MLPDDPASQPTIEPAAEGLPGYVAGPAPVAVGAGPRRISGLVVGVAPVVVALLGGGGLFLSGYALGAHQAGQPGTSPSDDAAFQPFWDAYHNVQSKFALGPVDRTTLVEGAIKGMVDALGDPYSAYLSPADFQSTLSDISGQFEGIGAEIGTVDGTGKVVDCSTFGPNCRLEISNPLPNSPALAAGLKPGDVVTAVDGVSLDGLTPDDATSKIRGPAGTSVKLHIVRAGTAPFDVTIVRAKITRQEVTTKDLAGGSVGYVKLDGFSETGADAVVAAVKADVAKGQKELILDLRGNPGGFVDAADRVASAFVGSGPIFWQQDVDGVQTETEAIPGGPATDPAIKVVVLVDGGSASASEIVTGALKDTHRATIIGVKTFGKGTVQTWIPLGNNGDEGGVKLTIAKWLTPDKTWIHKIGITPDVTVPIPANTPAGSDPVLDKALALFAAGSIPLPGSSPAPTAPPNGGPQSSGAPVGSPSSTGSSVPSSLEGAILKLAA
jgi:carboxyl-terminal processing protease